VPTILASPVIETPSVSTPNEDEEMVYYESTPTHEGNFWHASYAKK
jgi:hypothetical protein